MSKSVKKKKLGRKKFKSLLSAISVFGLIVLGLIEKILGTFNLRDFVMLQVFQVTFFIVSLYTASRGIWTHEKISSSGKILIYLFFLIAGLIVTEGITMLLLRLYGI